MAEALDKKGAFEDEGLEGRAHETLEREFNEVSSGRSYISSIYIYPCFTSIAWIRSCKNSSEIRAWSDSASNMRSCIAL
jgi:hypothetical protein